jgi:hypothetical protein
VENTLTLIGNVGGLDDDLIKSDAHNKHMSSDLALLTTSK